MVTYKKRRDCSCHRCSNETFPRLLRRQLYQRSLPKIETKEVSRHIVHSNQRSRKKKPKDPFENISHSERRLSKHNDKYHMRPSVLPKLILIHLLLQRKYKPHETSNVQEVADDHLVLDQTTNKLVDKPIRRNSVDQLLLKYASIDKQHSREEEVPVQEPEARQATLLVSSSEKKEELFRHEYLYANNHSPYVEMSHVDYKENSSEHPERRARPYPHWSVLVLITE